MFLEGKTFIEELDEGLGIAGNTLEGKLAKELLNFGAVGRRKVCEVFSRRQRAILCVVDQCIRPTAGPKASRIGGQIKPRNAPKSTEFSSLYSSGEEGARCPR